MFDTVQRAMDDHHYAVDLFLDNTETGEQVDQPTDDKPSNATAASFLELSKRGLVLIATHAGGPGLLVEGYGTAAARDAALAKYNKGKVFQAGDLAAGGFEDHTGTDAFGIFITSAGIQRHFADNRSIVHVAACCSFQFAGDFKAREYFAYEGIQNETTLRTDAQRLWNRMHGEQDTGHNRAARVAYGAGGFSAGFKYKKKNESDLDTVLSPAVKSHVPEKDATIVVPTTVAAQVVFDTEMDTSVDPKKVIRVKGCKAKSKDPSWDGKFVLKFGLELNVVEEARLTVDAKHALGLRDKKSQELDGNLTPGTDHVGPNEDDYEWKIQCVGHR